MAWVLSDKPIEEIKVMCPHCRHMIAYVPNDVRKTLHTDYAGESNAYFWVDCPKCNKAIQVDRK